MRAMPGLPALSLAALAGLAGCGDTGSGADPDASFEPTLDGRWTVTRVVDDQPAGCRELQPGQLTVTFQVSPPLIEVDGARLMEWDQVVTARAAHFVTEDHGFPADPLRPVIIAHDLQWLNSQLVGTAGAMGDGDDLGCSWSVRLVGIQRFD